MRKRNNSFAAIKKRDAMSSNMQTVANADRRLLVRAIDALWTHAQANFAPAIIDEIETTLDDVLRKGL